MYMLFISGIFYHSLFQHLFHEIKIDIKKIIRIIQFKLHIETRIVQSAGLNVYLLIMIIHVKTEILTADSSLTFECLMEL